MSINKNSQNLSLDTKRHSFAHLMAAAVGQMFPEAQFGVGPVIETGCYYDFILPRTLIPEDLPLLETKIKEMLKQPLVFKVQEMELPDAISLFEKMNQPLKVELLNDLATRGTTAMSEEERADFEGDIPPAPLKGGDSEADGVDLSENSPFYLELEQKAKDLDKQIVVELIVTNEKNEVFAQRRSLTRKLYPGCWDIPGGHVDAGDNIYQTIEKELQEETGWKLKKVVDYLGEHIWTPFKDGSDPKRISFKFQIEVETTENPRLEEGKADKYLWINQDNLETVLENRKVEDTYTYDNIKNFWEKKRADFEGDIPPAPLKGGESASNVSRLYLALNSIGKRPFNFDIVNYNKELKDRTKDLRNNQTESEKEFWNKIRKHPELSKLTWNRQKPIGGFIADFYCRELNLVIEIDGSSHDNKKEYDFERDDIIKSQSLEILRFKNEEVENNINKVLENIYNWSLQKSPFYDSKLHTTNSPLSRGAGGDVSRQGGRGDVKITIYRLENEKTGEDLFVDLCKGPHVGNVKEFNSIISNQITLVETKERIDFEEIADILNERSFELNQKGIAAWAYPLPKDFLFKKMSENRTFKAVKNGEIVGSVIICDDSEEFAEQNIKLKNIKFIEKLCVKKSFKGKGLGGQILDLLEQKLQIEGISKIALDCIVEPDFLFNFYTKKGFKLIAKHKYIGKISGKECELAFLEKELKKTQLGFKLDKFSGSYWRGDQERNIQMQRIYALVFDTKDELKEFVDKREEAKKRDHRVLGQQLKLFTISDLVGAGLPLLQPNGMKIRENIEDYLWQLHKDKGYQRVWTPHIAKIDLYDTSGHSAKFGDELFRVKGKEDSFIMKPMNCPHHMQIFDDNQFSYREMPIRYFEPATVYRDEKTGQLSGLTRVRSITQDDGHLFCRVSQIKQEVSTIVGIIREFYDTLGMQPDWVSLSVRDPQTPEKYLGSDEVWAEAEKALEEAAKENDLPYKRVEGEAAFYGPKLDFMFKDALNREWQLSTIQADFNLPEKFNLSFVNEDGEKERPVVIHRAISGSLERFIGVMTEHFGGRFPFWLAPTQVKILTVNNEPETLEYVEKIKVILDEVVLMKPLKYNEIRYEVDDRNESLGKKIREATMLKIPVQIIVGPKDVEAGEVSVRTQEGEEKVKLEGLQEFIKNKV